MWVINPDPSLGFKKKYPMVRALALPLIFVIRILDEKRGTRKIDAISENG